MHEHDHDALIARLDGMSAPTPAAAPKALLATVRRRRRVRQARQATGVLLVLLALTPVVWVLSRPPQGTTIVENPDGPPAELPQRDVAFEPPANASLQHLIAMNRDAEQGEVVLPEPVGGRVPGILRVLDTLSAEAALERL